jgi:hypothetical protein
MLVAAVLILLVLIAGADAPRRRRARRLSGINLFTLFAFTRSPRLQTPDFLRD